MKQQQAIFISRQGAQAAMVKTARTYGIGVAVVLTDGVVRPVISRGEIMGYAAQLKQLPAGYVTEDHV